MSELRGHVLIIEDEPVIALELEALLGDLGYGSFDFADCPQEALLRARAIRPALITADFRINGGTGVEAVEMIVAACGPIPVIYVTGNPDLLPPTRCAAIIDKPISTRALALACARLMGRAA